MRALLPDKAIYALESQVITPNKMLNPTLGVIIRSDDSEDSRFYLRSIQKKGNQYNANVEVYECKNAIEASEAIIDLKHNPGVYGIINLSHFGGADRGLNNMIPMRLDIDCVSSNTLGNLLANPSNIGYRMAPCAAVSAAKLLEYEGYESLDGMRVAILGRSLRVGRPLAEILVQKNATVTVFHSKSELRGLSQYDIVVSAIGKPKFVNYYTHFWVGDEYKFHTQYIIDIGTNPDENGKICGDIDVDSFEYVSKSDMCCITPVPGGIGKLSTVVLFSKLFSNAANANGYYDE